MRAERKEFKNELVKMSANLDVAKKEVLAAEEDAFENSIAADEMQQKQKN